MLYRTVICDHLASSVRKFDLVFLAVILCHRRRHCACGRRGTTSSPRLRSGQAAHASIFSKPTRGITSVLPRTRSATSRITSPSIRMPRPTAQYVAVAPLLDTIIATVVVRHARPQCADRTTSSASRRWRRPIMGVLAVAGGLGPRHPRVRSPRRAHRRRFSPPCCPATFSIARWSASSITTRSKCCCRSRRSPLASPIGLGDPWRRQSVLGCISSPGPAVRISCSSSRCGSS